MHSNSVAMKSIGILRPPLLGMVAKPSLTRFKGVPHPPSLVSSQEHFSSNQEPNHYPASIRVRSRFPVSSQVRSQYHVSNQVRSGRRVSHWAHPRYLASSQERFGHHVSTQGHFGRSVSSLARSTKGTDYQ